MSMSDPLADMITRIRNAVMVNFRTVEMPLSTLKVGVAKVLKDEGFIEDYIDQGACPPLGQALWHNNGQGSTDDHSGACLYVTDLVHTLNSAR